MINIEPIKVTDKILLNIKEASAYSGIGETKLRSLLNTPHCDFFLLNGNKRLIKRKQFERWLNSQDII